MTAPRQVLPGASYLVTRRCSQRQLLLRPSRTTTEVFLFLLAVAARRYGIRLHAFCVLSNHYHLVLTDPNAQLPFFQQFLDALLARALNAALGRWEAFWAPDSYSAVALTSRADIIDKSAYVLANPVAAGLVRAGRLWPGAWSAPETIGGEPLVVRRPKHFFDENGTLPEEMPLRLTLPPGPGSAAEFRDLVRVALEEREAKANQNTRGFLGAARVLAQKSTDRPRSGEPRRALNPRVAARDKWKRIEALGRLVGFLRSYREAWIARREGRGSFVFPAGTWLLRVQHGVACAGAG